MKNDYRDKVEWYVENIEKESTCCYIHCINFIYLIKIILIRCCNVIIYDDDIKICITTAVVLVIVEKLVIVAPVAILAKQKTVRTTHLLVINNVKKLSTYMNIE